MTAAKFLSLTTSEVGTDFVAFEDSPCSIANVWNLTGQSLTFKYANDAGTFVLPTGLAYAFCGLNNANQLRVKRSDESNTPVTLNSVEVEL
ncbi:hypothetical protein UFOVP1329_4 [uncultured Caudovirales phage]|uniref:Uncharacterized protein n=1 Tax=uncultured Caudovirales phage TaxID=2100421 RepID=A0A6J5S1F4_9CAUD|nr:hypothetical protein UFOVP1150_29 [uncultured Caudovirales phage]CAB4198885.1 hypothetical protein UFOVP1329_4 [uncultured Caudovirales phage]CAB4218690.1 hypothetical protein UFOVP1595_32 [uncultured Caudovirales phage]